MGAEEGVGDAEQGPEIPPGGTAFPDAHSAGSGSMAFVGGLMEDNAARRLAETPAGGGGIGASMLIDPERAQQAVDTLKVVIDDLVAAGRRWRYDRSVVAPGDDPVSLQLAKNMQTMADRAGAWLEAWTEQIQHTRDALQAQIDAYRRVEQENRERFS